MMLQRMVIRNVVVDSSNMPGKMLSALGISVRMIPGKPHATRLYLVLYNRLPFFSLCTGCGLVAHNKHVNFAPPC